MKYLYMLFADKSTGLWPYLKSKLDSDFPVFLRLGDFEIRWYAICILLGIIVTYLWNKHQLKKYKMPEDYFDNFLILLVPIVLIGARLWYAISSPGAISSILEFIGFYNGRFVGLSGLAIQGGAIFGFIFGFIYFTFIKKRYPFALIFDMAGPTMLIGQVIGRWGNFFNGEVYGKLVSRKALWFIPNFIINNCTLASSVGSQYGESEVYIPLFYIEGIINLVGFILICFVAFNFWKKYRKPYFVGALYFIWYGVARFLLEPLRMEEYQMGTSQQMSIAFVIIGVLIIIYAFIRYKNVSLKDGYTNFAYEKLILEKQKKDEEELQKQIDAKKAEIRARKAKENK